MKANLEPPFTEHNQTLAWLVKYNKLKAKTNIMIKYNKLNLQINKINKLKILISKWNKIKFINKNKNIIMKLNNNMMNRNPKLMINWEKHTGHKLWREDKEKYNRWELYKLKKKKIMSLSI